MNTGTQIFKIHKIQHLSQFHNYLFLKYPIFTSKTTALLKRMTEETNLYRNEHYSCMTGVTMGQKFKTYPTIQCKFLLILKIGAPVFIGATWMQYTE